MCLHFLRKIARLSDGNSELAFGRIISVVPDSRMSFLCVDSESYSVFTFEPRHYIELVVVDCILVVSIVRCIRISAMLVVTYI